MSFRIHFRKISAANQPSSGIMFETTLDNQAPRTATILSYNFQLWLVHDQQGAQRDFLAQLLPELRSSGDFPRKFSPHDQRPFRLLWHYTDRQVQAVEDHRKGGNPLFEIRGHFAVMSVWPARANFPEQTQFDWEEPILADSGSYPIRPTIAQSDWIAALNEIGFKHAILYEFPLTSFPPGFSRSEAHLQQAWEHHRVGRYDEALSACQKGFECLGFRLYGNVAASRGDILKQLMDGQEEEKRKLIEKLWISLQDFLHLGRHEKGQPVSLTESDSEMALLCATAILGYLAKVR